MKYKTLARILMKLLGVYFFIAGLAPLLSNVGNQLINMSRSPNFASTGLGPDWFWLIPNALYWGVQITAGLYLFFGGRWVLNKIIPSEGVYCPECGYLLRPPIRAHCTECGTALPNDIRTPTSAG